MSTDVRSRRVGGELDATLEDGLSSVSDVDEKQPAMCNGRSRLRTCILQFATVSIIFVLVYTFVRMSKPGAVAQIQTDASSTTATPSSTPKQSPLLHPTDKLRATSSAQQSPTWSVSQPPALDALRASPQVQAKNVSSASSSSPAPAPRLPQSWRHPLQQRQGLPPGPERPVRSSPSGKVSQVRCETTAGPIDIDVHHGWAPHGASRFMDMVRSGFFSSEVALFRSVSGFICQTGVAGDPVVHRTWSSKGRIPDDKQWLDQSEASPMKRGYLSFAGGGQNSRGTEFFFAYRDVGLGRSPWEVPFGTLVGKHSFEAMDHWYTGYGDMKVFGGHAPEQGRMYAQGVRYVKANFPEIDYITQCSAKDDGQLITA